MEGVIFTDCIYTTDPHSVIVSVQPPGRSDRVYIGQFYIHDYEAMKGVLGFPDVVCEGPFSE